MSYDRSRVLVTGGAGFLGRYVVARLAADGHDVTTFDVVPPDQPGVSFTPGDVRDRDVVRKAVAGHDVVCHLAAMASLNTTFHELAEASAVNAVGTANVVEAALAENARVVYASTWEVYGPPVRQPVDEDHPCRPEHPYGITKLAGESLLLAATHFHGLSGIALRLATTYGIGLRGNSVFEVFRRRAMNGQGIEVHGDGKQYRQFLHARDAARAIEIACRSDVTNAVYNVAPEQPVTIGELARLVTERFDVPLTYGEPRVGDAEPLMLTADRIRADLGWESQEDFATALGRLLDGVDDRQPES